MSQAIFIGSQRVERLAMNDLRICIPNIFSGARISKVGIADQAFGDFVIHRPLQRDILVELKSEKAWTGNLFIETWSNGSRDTEGWIHTAFYEWLWYYFVKKRRLVVLHFRELQEFIIPRLDEFRETMAKCEQLNDTWGRLVPVELLAQNLRDICVREVLEFRRDFCGRPYRKPFRVHFLDPFAEADCRMIREFMEKREGQCLGIL